MLRAIFLISFFLFAYPAFAQPKKINEKDWNASLDQDFFLQMFGLNEDRNYTMGLSFKSGSNTTGMKKIFSPLRFINRTLGYKKMSDTSNYYYWMIANGAFTPDSLQDYSIIKNDRPYASITILQTGSSYYNIDKHIFTTNSFSAGIIGTGLARIMQTKIHNLMNDHDTKDPHTPRGWPHQISRTGEPTFLFTSQREILAAPDRVKALLTLSSVLPAPPPKAKWGLEFKYGYKYSLGYYTDANLLFQFRAGFINPLNWTVSTNSNGDVNQLRESISSANPGAGNNIVNNLWKKHQFEGYLFGSIRPKLMLYNALLYGQFYNSPHVLSFSEAEQFIVEFDGGLGFTIPCKDKSKAFNLKIRISGRSPEIKFETRPVRWHFWGGIELSHSKLW